MDTLNNICGALGGLCGTAAFLCYLYNVFRHLQFKTETHGDGPSRTVTITNPRCVGVCIANILADPDGTGRNVRRLDMAPGEHFPKCLPPWAFTDVFVSNWAKYNVAANVKGRIVLVTTSGTQLYSQRGIFLDEHQLAAAREQADARKALRRAMKVPAVP